MQAQSPSSSSTSASSTAYIASLKLKHETLEAKLQEERLRPHPDDFRIQQLKKQKLALKQELAEAQQN